MSIDKLPEVRLFGFRISKTATIILAFIALTLFIQHIPQVYYSGLFLVYNLIQNTIPEILANIGEYIQVIFNLLIQLTIVSFLLTIFILCAKIQNSFRHEDVYVRWFFYRLTKASMAVLFMLSLVYLITNSINLYNSVNSLLFFITHTAGIYVNHYIFLTVATLILMLIHIYTLIICVKNRETLI